MRLSEEELETELPLVVREEKVFLFILKKKKETKITVGRINGKEEGTKFFLKANDCS